MEEGSEGTQPWGCQRKSLLQPDQCWVGGEVASGGGIQPAGTTPQAFQDWKGQETLAGNRRQEGVALVPS